MMDDESWAEYPHEQILEAAVRHLLSTSALDRICDEAGFPVLIHGTGEPVTVAAARTYRDADVSTLDRGVWLELSDGSRYALTITCSGRPDREVTLRPPEPQQPRQRASSVQCPRRRASRPAVGPCGCECGRGGFCGGCGHAGCGRR